MTGAWLAIGAIGVSACVLGACIVAYAAAARSGGEMNGDCK